MERSEQAGLGIAAVAHVALFAALSASLLAPKLPKPVSPPAMDVSLVDEVALTATAPAAVEPPAPSIAPETGPPEDAAPPAPAPEPQPAPPVKRTEPTPPPKPAAVAKPQPKPAAPAKPQVAAKPVAKPAAPGTGKQVAATQARPRGSILGSDFLKGITADRTPPTATGQVARAATVDAKARADIASAITRQVQPCANQQINPGPGAEKIRVDIRLSINRDGSLATRPQIIGRSGVDDSNARYADRVEDLAIATFVGCAPLRGLPADLYAVPGGWKLFTLRYKLPG